MEKLTIALRLLISTRDPGGSKGVTLYQSDVGVSTHLTVVSSWRPRCLPRTPLLTATDGLHLAKEGDCNLEERLLSK